MGRLSRQDTLCKCLQVVAALLFEDKFCSLFLLAVLVQCVYNLRFVLPILWSWLPGWRCQSFALVVSCGSSFVRFGVYCLGPIVSAPCPLAFVFVARLFDHICPCSRVGVVWKCPVGFVIVVSVKIRVSVIMFGNELLQLKYQVGCPLDYKFLKIIVEIILFVVCFLVSKRCQ